MAGQFLKVAQVVLEFLVSSAEAPALDITCDAPPDGTVGVAYSHTFPATGGAPPYTFSITVGVLPDGLVLDPATGIVSGTPTLDGVYPFTITVTDSSLASASVDCSITILPPPVLEITCASPPNVDVGQAYAHFFPATGGTLPYTFAITSGSLPPGLSLDASSGLVSGVATAMGVYPFTITVTDSAAPPLSASVDCSITIFGAVMLQLIGWKLYPDVPCETAVEGIEIPSVKRAV